MMLWPSIAAVVIFSIWMFTMHKGAVLRLAESKDASNIQFLMAETAASSRVEERKLAMVRVEAQRNIGGSSMSAILATLADGHAHDCAYCSCGHSKIMDSVKVANREAQKKKGAFEQMMIADGWTPPPHQDAIETAERTIALAKSGGGRTI